MVKILLNGCLGKMGQAVEACVNSREDVMIIAGVDIAEGDRTYPVHTCFVDVAEDAREVRSVFTPKNCNQCKDPACLHACRHKAIAKGIDGVVRIDRARCKGCGECVKACPFGEIFLEKTEGKAVKCEFCRGDRGVPACVEACASHARLFGDTLHPEGAFAEALKNARLKALDADFKDKLSGTCYIELARS